MKPNAPIDVADFFKQQLDQQEIAPPDYIWSNIESEIPAYPTKPTWTWWMLNSLAVVVILSVATYFWIHHNTTSSKSTASIAYKHTAAIDISKQVYQDNTVADPKSEQSKIKTQTNNASQLQQTVYYIEASTAGKLDKIEILDSLNKLKKTIVNPTPNDYGFYEMNIQQLKPGKYIIVLYRKDGSIVQRIETFR